MIKNFYVTDMPQRIGETVESFFYCSSVKINMAASGKKHAVIELQDKTGSVKAKMWSESLTGNEPELEGKVIKVLAKVNLYDGLPSVILAVAQVAEDGSFDFNELVKGLTEEQRNFCISRINQYTNLIGNEGVKELLECVFSGNTLESFLSLPAGLKHHHNFNGGLIVHTLEVLDAAYSFAKTNDKYGEIKGYTRKVNMDLLIAGALLHDLGKVEEYTSFPSAKISDAGQLQGHLVSGVLMVERLVRALGINLEDRVLDELEHIILASHGADGVVVPKTLEAIIVSNADNMSAAVDYYSLFCEEYNKSHEDNESFAYSAIKAQSFMRR